MPLPGEITSTRDLMLLHGLIKLHEYIQSKIAIGVIKSIELVQNMSGENVVLRISGPGEEMWKQVLVPETERLADIRLLYIHEDSWVIEARCKLKDTPNINKERPYDL